MTFRLPNKIYSLDVLRGLAALAVVFWHWQHFFYIGDSPKGIIFDRQPFYDYLTILYKHGDSAVELFFCISGFIFYWLYSELIYKKEITAREFAINRISRLYPLYILTFIAVFSLQVIYRDSHGSYFVYQQNDLYHAILNILMIPAWGFESGWSFNAPVWSVSIEMMLYGIFFLICLLGRRGLYFIPAFIATGYFTFPINYKVGIGMFSFFCGGATYILTKTVINKWNNNSILISLCAFIAAWSIIIHFGVSNIFLISAFGFTSLILFLTTLSTIPLCNDFFHKFRWIGDISYSSYLIHFPLQIIFSLCADALGYERDIFYSSKSIVIFMMVLIPLSLLTHHYFEIKSQRYMRKKFNKIKNTREIIKQG